MKVWLKRQGHRVGGRLPGASKSAVMGQGGWQQGGGNPERFASCIGDSRNITSFDGR